MKRREWPVGDSIEEFTDESEDTFPEAVRDAIAEIVDDLPDEHRMVVEMRIWQRLPYRKIASMLGYASHKSAIDRFNEALDMVKEKIHNSEDS